MPTDDNKKPDVDSSDKKKDENPAPEKPISDPPLKLKKKIIDPMICIVEGCNKPRALPSPYCKAHQPPMKGGFNAK